MLTAVPFFNTLRYADELIAAGIPDAQARATVNMLADVLEAQSDRLATKEDIRLVKEDLRLLEGKVENDLKLLGTELRGEMKAMQVSLEGQIGTFKWMSSPVALVALIWVAKEALKIFGVAG